jgi:hypothetical protein
MFDQMECLDDDDDEDDLISLYDTSQCSKSCQLKVSMRNLIKHLKYFYYTFDYGINVPMLMSFKYVLTWKMELNATEKGAVDT